MLVLLLIIGRIVVFVVLHNERFTSHNARRSITASSVVLCKSVASIHWRRR
jgi:hypothetical protein